MDQISTIMNWLVSLTALAVAIYSLYLQRRDKKPRLKVEHKPGLRPIELVDDGFSGHTLADDFCLVITLRNPTEKEITVSEIQFDCGRKVFKLTAWDALPTVGSHKAAEVIIPRQNLLNQSGMETKVKGHIKVKDLLGNISSSENRYYDLNDARSFCASETEYLKHQKRRMDEKEAWESGDS
jgi:hypothetical protein